MLDKEGSIEFYIVQLRKMSSELLERDEKLETLYAKFKQFSLLMRALCDSLPIMIWAKDVEEKYLFANKMCCEWLLSTNADEVVGKTDIFFAAREQAAHPGEKWHTFGDTCHKSDQQVLKTGKSLHLVETGYIKGKQVSIDVIKTPFLDNGNNFVGIVGCAKDITGLMRRKEDNPKEVP